MENNHLRKRIDSTRTRTSMEYAIDELIAEIEQLEADKNEMADKIASLSETIDSLTKTN